MTSPYKIGKLKLKSGTIQPRYIPKKIKKQQQPQNESSEEIKVKDRITTYEPKAGTGKISTSSRTVHGLETLFKTQLQKGDFILIQHPIFKTVEQRPITLILSDKSILLEQPFVQEYSQFVDYMTRKKSKVTEGENITKQFKKKIQDIGKTKNVKKEIDLRLKKGMWSYEKKTIEVNDNASREELLNIRQKVNKDKFCW